MAKRLRALVDLMLFLKDTTLKNTHEDIVPHLYNLHEFLQSCLTCSSTRQFFYLIELFESNGVLERLIATESQGLEKKNASKDLIAFLRAKGAMNVVKDISTLKNIMLFFPPHILTQFLYHFGYQNIPGLIKEKRDLVELRSILDREIPTILFMGVPGRFFFCYRYLEEIVFPKKSNIFGLSSVSAREIKHTIDYKKGILDVEFVPHQLDIDIATRVKELKIEEVRAITKEERRVRLGNFIENLWNAKQLACFEIPPVVERLFGEFCQLIKNTKIEKEVVVEKWKVTWNIFSFLECEFEIQRKSNETKEMLKNTTIDFHLLLEIDLDLYHSNRIHFIDAMGGMRKLQVIYRESCQKDNKNYSDGESLLNYLYSNQPLSLFIVTTKQLINFLTHYPAFLQWRFLEKLGIDHIKQKIILNKVDLDAVLSLIVDEMQRSRFAARFDFKEAVVATVSRSKLAKSEELSLSVGGAVTSPPNNLNGARFFPSLKRAPLKELKDNTPKVGVALPPIRGPIKLVAAGRANNS